MCWTEAMVKPVHGENGDGVEKLAVDQADQWRLDHCDGGLIQPAHQADISELGETTLTFIDGQFSHAVRRELAPGEWRANLQFGTVPVQTYPSIEIIEAARQYLDCAPTLPLYARVDGLVRPDGFMLMELELISPYLYLELAAGSAERLADAIIGRVHHPFPA